MPIAAASLPLLRDLLDSFAPATGSVGRATILSGTVFSGNVTITPASDLITTGSAHGLVTGSRVRVAATVTAPSPLLTTADYYVIVITGTTLKLAASIDDAIGNVPINIVDVGSGTISITEQTLNLADTLAVQLNKEVSHAGYTSRPLIENVGAAVAVGIGAQKLPINISLVNSGGTGLSFRHVLLLFGASASATIGSSTGVESQSLVDLGADTTVAADDGRVFEITIRMT